MTATLPNISAAEISRTRLPLEQAWTLPPAAYTSDGIFAAEVQRIMRRSWLPLARVDQLPGPGDYLAFDLLGQPMMVVRGADGTIRAMSSVCLHRAAPVVTEAKGRRNLFTCPYHAWAYDTAGQLVRAPLMDGATGKPLAVMDGNRLTTWRTAAALRKAGPLSQVAVR